MQENLNLFEQQIKDGDKEKIVCPTFYSMDDFKRAVRKAVGASEHDSGFRVGTASFYRSILLSEFQGIWGDRNLREQWKSIIDETAQEIVNEAEKDSEQRKKAIG